MQFTFAKIIEFYLHSQMLPAEMLSWPHFSWPTLYVCVCLSGVVLV